MLEPHSSPLGVDASAWADIPPGVWRGPCTWLCWRQRVLERLEQEPVQESPSKGVQVRSPTACLLVPRNECPTWWLHWSAHNQVKNPHSESNPCPEVRKSPWPSLVSSETSLRAA